LDFQCWTWIQFTANRGEKGIWKDVFCCRLQVAGCRLIGNIVKVNLNDIFYDKDEELGGESSSGARTRIEIKG
jgi:hypothetical protein